MALENECEGGNRLYPYTACPVTITTDGLKQPSAHCGAKFSKSRFRRGKLPCSSNSSAGARSTGRNGAGALLRFLGLGLSRQQRRPPPSPWRPGRRLASGLGPMSLVNLQCRHLSAKAHEPAPAKSWSKASKAQAAPDKSRVREVTALLHFRAPRDVGGRGSSTAGIIHKVRAAAPARGTSRLRPG